MGKPTGFMEYDREETIAVEPKERIKNFNEFHIPLSKEKRREQGARCMDCGVPFCQSGMELMGMTSGCPLHNLVPEWNDLVYEDNLKRAYERLIKTNNFPEFTSRVCPALCEKACLRIERKRFLSVKMRTVLLKLPMKKDVQRQDRQR